MAFVKPVTRRLPDGRWANVLPFHISFEGLEKNIICRDDQDCDLLVKTLALCARRKNVIIIIYAVVSNHAHVAVLARSYKEALAFAEEVKRVYSMHFRRKYGEIKALKGTNVNVQILDNDWYLRNALAYIPRNAFDNGAEIIADYKWTGFRAYFKKEKPAGILRRVADMSEKEWRQIFHTGDDLSNTTWLVNANDELEPISFCDKEYLEQAFNGDEAFFYKSVGMVNVPEMTQKLVVSPRKMKTDAEFMKDLESVSDRWFHSSARCLSSDQQARLLPYIFRTNKTSVAQMSRALGMEKDAIRKLLNLNRSS